MLIQCTKKLLEQLNIKPAIPTESEPLFSWHANLITAGRRKTVVLVNDKNRYILILYGLKAKDFKKLDELILQTIRAALEDEGIKDDIIDQFIKHSKEITYGKTKDRTSVARMNKSCEALYYADDLLREDSVCQGAMSAKASRFMVGNGNNHYINPNEAMYNDLEAFSGKSIFGYKAAELKVTLDLEKHTVWRRLAVPLNMTFTKLHKVLQDAFGWRDYHLHEFYIYKEYKPVINLVCDEEAFAYPNDVPMKLEGNIKLSEYIPEHKRIKYNYDFGDNWQHYIEVEKIIDDYDSNYPVCLEGEGNTPPEDVGGEPGYEEFLQIMADKKHPEHNNMTAWGAGQGYKDFDIEMVNRRLKY